MELENECKSWMKILHSEISSYVINNGYALGERVVKGSDNAIRYDFVFLHSVLNSLLLQFVKTYTWRCLTKEAEFKNSQLADDTISFIS